MAIAVGGSTLGGGVALGAGGGVSPPAAPILTGASCVNRCVGAHKATKGSTVQLTGSHLGEVDNVLFDAKAGGRVSARPTSASGRVVDVVVPHGAGSGKPRVEDPYGHRVASPEELRVVSSDR